MCPMKIKIQPFILFCLVGIMGCQGEETEECKDINGGAEQIGQMEINGSMVCAAQVQILYHTFNTNGANHQQLTWTMSSETLDNGCLENECREVSITVRTPFPNTNNVSLQIFEGTLRDLTDLGLLLDITYKNSRVGTEPIIVDPYLEPSELNVSINYQGASFNFARVEIRGNVGIQTDEGTELVSWHSMAFRR